MCARDHANRIFHQILLGIPISRLIHNLSMLPTLTRLEFQIVVSETRETILVLHDENVPTASVREELGEFRTRIV